MENTVRDLLAERLIRLEKAQGETNARLDQVVDVLGGISNILVALKDGQERLVERVDRLSESIMRGFTSRDEQIADLRHRVEWLENAVRKGDPQRR